MKQNNNKIEFSYYELSLLSYLRENHPDKADDIAFIKSHADAAGEAYQMAFENGGDVQQCIDAANRVLYQGLHFSKYNTVVSVLLQEFSGEVPQSDVFSTAKRLLPQLEEVFAKFTFSDIFGYSEDFQPLYTELTGVIQLIWEENGKL